MGIRGLESFAEREGAWYDVDIREFVRRRSCPRGEEDGRPVLLVDASALKRPIYEGLDRLGGGEGLILWRRLATFLRAFDEANIRLYFVADGGTPFQMRQEYIRRRYQSADMVAIPLMKALDEGDAVAMEAILNGWTSILPQMDFFALLDDLGAELIRSTVNKGVDADWLTVRKAIDLNAFGILSQDSDFMIFQVPRRHHIAYLSLKHFQFRALFEHGEIRTRAYDQQKLADILGIQVGQLPILASLKGNDVIDSQSLRKFHFWLIDYHGKPDHDRVFRLLGDFVRNELPNGRSIRYEIDKLSHWVFYGDESMTRPLHDSVMWYFLDVKEEGTQMRRVEQEEQKRSRSQVGNAWKDLLAMASSKVYQFMVENLSEYPTRIADYEQHGSPDDDVPIPIVIGEPLVERLYGVVLYEKPGAIKNKKFVIQIEKVHMTGLGSLDERKFFLPRMPPNHPGLKRLWTGQDPETKALRFRMYCYIVSPSLSYKRLMEFPEYRVYLISILHMMQNATGGPILYKHEVEAFIYHQFQVTNWIDKILNEGDEVKLIPSYPMRELYNKRGVCLATLFTSVPLFRASEVVGHVVPRKYMLCYRNIMGSEFQNLYLQAIQDPETVMNLVKMLEMDFQEEFHQIYDFVTQKGLQVKVKKSN